uniref:Thioredoxin-like fold domain-containing protein n=1 Tax=Geoglobus ahangari TaxID=113653 RepID=A0A7C3UCW8_9EURY
MSHTAGRIMTLIFIYYRDEALKVAEYLESFFELELLKEERDDFSFTIKTEDSGHINYDFIPEMHELTALPNIARKLFGEKISNIKAKIDIYVTNFCPTCPKVVENVVKLAAKNENLEIYVRDATKTDYQSVPVIVLNDTFTFIGTVDLDILISIAKGERVRDYLEKALSEQKIDFAEKVVKKGYVKELMEILKDGNLIARMGTILLIEKLKDSEIANELRKSLREMILSDDLRAADDAVMALSYIMNPEDMKFLKKAMRKVDEKIREAIKDILELD